MGGGGSSLNTGIQGNAGNDAENRPFPSIISYRAYATGAHGWPEPPPYKVEAASALVFRIHSPCSSTHAHRLLRTAGCDGLPTHPPTG
jgi:hypothetical protein